MRDPAPRALPQALDLSGKRVLVTGASSGIGQSAAVNLARLGADLVLADLAPLEATARQVREAGASCRSERGDLAEDGFLRGLVEIGPYHGLAHCAALFNRPGWRPELSDKERFHLLMDVNVRVPIELGCRCIDRMATQGGGYIVLVGSAAGRNGGGISGGTPVEYAASKGAVHTLVRSLSRRGVGGNVLVNGVAPGPVATPMAAGLPFAPSALPLGRMGQPEEIGWVIALLCTSAASYISGAVIDVNGGAFVG